MFIAKDSAPSPPRDDGSCHTTRSTALDKRTGKKKNKANRDVEKSASVVVPGALTEIVPAKKQPK